ncbi:MAG: DinB family protein, partial [Gemmatimonadaceae bacterium]
MKRLFALSALVFAVPAAAQNMSMAAPASAVSTTRGIWHDYADYVLKSAEQMPEANYSYKPVATVRSFGELLGHVAGAQYSFCAAALGEVPKGEGDIEKTVTSKAGLVAAMKGSTEYCQRAYAQTDAQAAAMTKFFGSESSRMYVLTL